MTNSYSRAVGGDRAKSSKPCRTEEKYPLIGAISMFGIVALTYLKLAVNTDIFIAYIKHCLLPNIKAGQYVIMDNVRFHKNAEILDLIESKGAKVVFLPPYSPDLSPIEKMWSKIKEILKRLKPRNSSDFYTAIAQAADDVTQSDCEEWFASCGYCNE